MFDLAHQILEDILGPFDLRRPVWRQIWLATFVCSAIGLGIQTWQQPAPIAINVTVPQPSQTQSTQTLYVPATPNDPAAIWSPSITPATPDSGSKAIAADRVTHNSSNTIRLSGETLGVSNFNPESAISG